MHFCFLTSTPPNIARGSGTFAGITTLAKFLKRWGADVDLITPVVKVPVYTLERLIFNQMLRLRPIDADGITVGFDMDGYPLAGKKGGFHVASIKGVIADEMRFEHGVTRATMRLQAGCEKIHVQRADLVVAPSQYSSERIQELYGIDREPRVVPEAIDLAEWRQLLQRNPTPAAKDKFVVLSVCRFYPRKRLHILLGAVNRLRPRIAGLEVRIVGDGPEAARLESLCRGLRLDGIVKWLGNVTADELAREYNRCNIFCLPSVQESFGIVFLEAMASGKPIVAARAASAPEVVKHGILVEPGNEAAVAEGIEQLYRNPALRETSADSARHWVKQFDAPLIAASFLREIELATGVPAPARIHAVG